jgi:uncharacterized protein with HEPN domain
MRSAGALLDEFTANVSFEEFEDDAKLRAAVERQLEIIGEALRRALTLEPTLSARITDARRVVDFRNVLAHGYFAVSHELVWGIVRGAWPVLRGEIDGLIQEAIGTGPSGNP